jgi:hypothetical protein
MAIDNLIKTFLIKLIDVELTEVDPSDKTVTTLMIKHNMYY